jgi:hypothetical protein
MQTSMLISSITLKSSYEVWHKSFVDHKAERAKICDESRTLVAKANETTALVSCFAVDMPAFKSMIQDPVFIKMNEPMASNMMLYTLTPLQG